MPKIDSLNAIKKNEELSLSDIIYQQMESFIMKYYKRIYFKFLNFLFQLKKKSLKVW
jgi:hypothetical protein